MFKAFFLFALLELQELYMHLITFFRLKRFLNDNKVRVAFVQLRKIA